MSEAKHTPTLNDVHKPTPFRVAAHFAREIEEIIEKEPKSVRLDKIATVLLACSAQLKHVAGDIELSRLHDINRELLEALCGLVAQYRKLSDPDDPVSAITERYWGALYRNAEAAIRKAIMTEQKPRHICKPSCHNPCLLDEEPKPVGEPVDEERRSFVHWVGVVRGEGDAIYEYEPMGWTVWQAAWQAARADRAALLKKIEEAQKDLAADDRDMQIIAGELGITEVTREAIVKHIRALCRLRDINRELCEALNASLLMLYNPNPQEWHGAGEWWALHKQAIDKSELVIRRIQIMEAEK